MSSFGLIFQKNNLKFKSNQSICNRIGSTFKFPYYFFKSNLYKVIFLLNKIINILHIIIACSQIVKENIWRGTALLLSSSHKLTYYAKNIQKLKYNKQVKVPHSLSLKTKKLELL